MTNQSVRASSDPIAAKLLEANAELASQEAELLAQIEAVQNKRKSLETVLSMFGSPEATPAPKPASPAVEPVSEPAVLVEASSTPEQPTTAIRRRRDTTVAKDSAGKAKKPRATKATKTTVKEKSASSSVKPAAAGGVKPWQGFVRKEFRALSLPQAVLAILQQHPTDVVAVTTIMDRLFEDNIPNDTRLEGRDRLSNVMSVGLKNNKWYRGGTGLYSISKEAAEASLGS